MGQCPACRWELATTPAERARAQAAGEGVRLHVERVKDRRYTQDRRFKKTTRGN